MPTSGGVFYSQVLVTTGRPLLRRGDAKPDNSSGCTMLKIVIHV